MPVRHVRWLVALLLVLALGTVDLIRHVVWTVPLHGWPGSLLVLVPVAVALALGAGVLLDRVEIAERRLAEQNAALARASDVVRQQAAQLRAVHESGLALATEHDVAVLLQRVVDLARELVGARYGALGVFDAQGRIVRFLVSGLSAEERAAVGDPPKGRGLLGAVLTEGRPVRVDNIASDPRAVGFPPGHPVMTTFLGVPLVARGRTFGNLYLADKLGPHGVLPFTPADEELLLLFGAQAAVAIENAQLLAEVQGLAATVERERIARELHDSLAQVLGYVRLRAAAGADALRDGDSGGARRAFDDISAAAGEAYADVREAILGLRSQVGGGRDLWTALREYLERYRMQTGLAVSLELDASVGAARLAPEAEVQLLRIIQEALANVRKHAAAHQAWVRVERTLAPTGPHLRTTIADDGRGFDPQQRTSGAQFGLATMHERAAAAGGTCRVESAPGRGTRVIVELPLAGEAAAAAAQRGLS